MEAAACKLEPKVEGRIMQLTPEVNIPIIFLPFSAPYFFCFSFHISNPEVNIPITFLPFLHNISSVFLFIFLPQRCIFQSYFSHFLHHILSMFQICSSNIFFSWMIQTMFLLLLLIIALLIFVMIISFFYNFHFVLLLRANKHMWLMWGCDCKEGGEFSLKNIKIDLFCFLFVYSSGSR